MYLSRVEIDLNDRKKTRDLTHVGAFHNWVECCFPQEIEESVRRRKLWRIDQLGGKQYLLMVSEERPDLACLERYGVETSGKVKSYDRFLESLYEGMKARFRVTLNPVASISKTGERGRVVPLVDLQQQMEFLLARAEKNGFLLSEGEFMVVERGQSLLKKANQRDLRLIKATYEGNLTINELEQFKRTLTEGFGKKKAYGFGLMTVIPMSDA